MIFKILNAKVSVRVIAYLAPRISSYCGDRSFQFYIEIKIVVILKIQDYTITNVRVTVYIALEDTSYTNFLN